MGGPRRAAAEALYTFPLTSAWGGPRSSAPRPRGKDNCGSQQWSCDAPALPPTSYFPSTWRGMSQGAAFGAGSRMIRQRVARSRGCAAAAVRFQSILIPQRRPSSLCPRTPDVAVASLPDHRASVVRPHGTTCPLRAESVFCLRRDRPHTHACTRNAGLIHPELFKHRGTRTQWEPRLSQVWGYNGAPVAPPWRWNHTDLHGMRQRGTACRRLLRNNGPRSTAGSQRSVPRVGVTRAAFRGEAHGARSTRHGVAHVLPQRVCLHWWLCRLLTRPSMELTQGPTPCCADRDPQPHCVTGHYCATGHGTTRPGRSESPLAQPHTLDHG